MQADKMGIVYNRDGDVLEKIASLIKGIQPTEKSVGYFISTGYQDIKGEGRKEFLLTRDGFTLLAMGFTGAKALEWKLKYIEAFNQMEHELLEYKPKMTSLGEVTNYIKIVSRCMKEQGCSSNQIMQMIDDVNKQFGINLPKLAKINPWEQMTVICIKQ